jgi:hypothetical protein
MKLANLTSSNFNEIIKLLKKKRSLAVKTLAIDQKIQKIDQQLAAYESGKPAAATRTTRGPGRPAKATKVTTGRKGGVKELILHALKEAGSAGASVPELATKLGMKVVNVRAWIYTTGKGAGVKSVSRGVFAVSGSGNSATKPAKAKPGPKAGSKVVGRKLSPVTEKLLVAFKDAGKAGMTVPVAAKKTGMKPVNVQAWVKGTAKKLGLKRIKRGVYALA